MLCNTFSAHTLCSNCRIYYRYGMENIKGRDNPSWWCLVSSNCFIHGDLHVHSLYCQWLVYSWWSTNSLLALCISCFVIFEKKIIYLAQLWLWQWEEESQSWPYNYEGNQRWMEDFFNNLSNAKCRLCRSHCPLCNYWVLLLSTQGSLRQHINRGTWLCLPGTAQQRRVGE